MIYQKWHICVSKLAIIVLEFELYTPLCETQENVSPIVKSQATIFICEYIVSRNYFLFMEETLH